MSAKDKKPVRRPRHNEGYDTGVEVLRINVDALKDIYKDTIDVAKRMMQAGAANGALAWFGAGIYADLLHGGAYSCAMTERPYYFGGINPQSTWTPTTSKYDPGPISLPSQGLLPWLGSLFIGPGGSPAQLFDEVIVDANCPHIFPKLLSDEAYALIKVGQSYALDKDIFTTGVTGLTTLVNAESNLIRATGEAVGEVGGALPKVAGALSTLIPALAAVG
jgi:hypothetical protein